MVDKTSVRTATTDRPTRRRPRTPYDRATEILAVLQHARGVVEAGWVQNRWTARPRAPARSRD